MSAFEPDDCWPCRGTGLGRQDGYRCWDCCGTGLAGERERRREAAEEEAEYRAQARRDDALCHRYYDGT